LLALGPRTMGLALVEVLLSESFNRRGEALPRVKQMRCGFDFDRRRGAHAHVIFDTIHSELFARLTVLQCGGYGLPIALRCGMSQPPNPR
jgi:hypothetical protein